MYLAYPAQGINPANLPFDLQLAATAKSLQSCPTLCDPRDGSPPGSTIPGILQTGTLEWVAISFSNAWEWKVKVKSLSHVWLLVTPWTAAHQDPPSMGFSRQEYWSGVPLPSLVGSVKIDLNCRTLSWCPLVAWCRRKNSHSVSVPNCNLLEKRNHSGVIYLCFLIMSEKKKTCS